MLKRSWLIHMIFIKKLLAVKIIKSKSDEKRLWKEVPYIRTVVNNSTHTLYKVYLNGAHQGYIDYRALHNINFVGYTNKNITAYGEYKTRKLGSGIFKIEKNQK